MPFRAPGHLDAADGGRPVALVCSSLPSLTSSRPVKLRYVVTIDQEEDGRFIASVPEVPGCHVYGRTRREAVARARRALQFYVDTLRSQGRKPPRQPLVAVEIVIPA